METGNGLDDKRSHNTTDLLVRCQIRHDGYPSGRVRRSRRRDAGRRHLVRRRGENAGTRGISRVEVSTDGGGTWENADLGPRLPGRDVWRQWRFQWKPRGGKHEIVVRATDGSGTVQPEEFRSAYPNGPTGWVSRTIEV
ncbi:hypothetical protein V5735_10490 (plasmid) [Haladaptatus sp. SPP-AMP-3]|uniref:hypothetical protein n=1 Tax=Haladaptatus sp. SPP-AMP-3 TaxID=3121295 RepID=UPI003C2FCCD4